MNLEVNTEPILSADRDLSPKRVLARSVANLITIFALEGIILVKGIGFFKSGGNLKIRKVINLIMKIIFAVILKSCNFMPYLMDMGLIFMKLTDPQC